MIAGRLITMETIVWALQQSAIVGFVALGVALLIWVSLHATLAVHEFGHAIAARLMGFPVRLIEIGTGYELLRLPIGLMQLRWRFIPDGGVTFVYRPFFLRRRTLVPYLLGGCVANLLAIVVLFAAMTEQTEQVRLYLLFLIVGQMTGVLEVFYVRRSRRTGMRPDGGALLAVLRSGPVSDRKWIRSYLAAIRGDYHGSTRERATTLSPVALHAVHVGGADRNAYVPSAHEEPADPQEVRRLRTALLRKKALTAAERAALLDALITEDLIVGDGYLLDLDDWSRELVALLPDDPNANASRGAVLALMGRREARRHLEMDFGADATPFALSLQHAFLARAFLNEGDFAAAREQIEKSKLRWDEFGQLPTLPIVAAIEKELSAAPR